MNHIPITGKFKPKGVGGFALVDAEDVEFPDGTRLNTKDFSGIYVGSGEMPEGYNVQIDPDGESLSYDKVLTCTEQTFTEEQKRIARANIGAISEEDVPSSLPKVTTADNGKFLRVVNGVWSVAIVESAEGASF